MISCELFYQTLKNSGIEFFAGVPDSLLKNFCFYIADHVGPQNHVICANEGSAVALASGYHLATGKIPAVYLQNSGTGNMINPLTSLCDNEVYSIPTLLIIGWRGEPGVKDEPQHKKQGRIMTELLDALEIPYGILEPTSDPQSVVQKALVSLKEKSCPYAILVRGDTFDDYKFQGKEKNPYVMSREDAIEEILKCVNPKDAVIATTGKTSRELYELRKKRGETNRADFLTVGSMGHTSQIALGVALEQKNRKVYCIDGDGSLLMHMGGMATIGALAPSNLIHIVINNGAHESVGGQGTGAFKIDLPAIAKATNYKTAACVVDSANLTQALQALEKNEGPHFLEVRTKQGSRPELGRPKSTPLENKQQFMKALDA